MHGIEIKSSSPYKTKWMTDKIRTKWPLLSDVICFKSLYKEPVEHFIFTLFKTPCYTVPCSDLRNLLVPWYGMYPWLMFRLSTNWFRIFPKYPCSLRSPCFISITICVRCCVTTCSAPPLPRHHYMSDWFACGCPRYYFCSEVESLCVCLIGS